MYIYCIFDIPSNPLCLKELDHDGLGIYRCSIDVNNIITYYGKYLINLGDSHDLIILNGITWFPLSSNFTCFPYAGEASVVDYVMANLSFALTISDLCISSVPPLIDHAFLSFNLLFVPK